MPTVYLRDVRAFYRDIQKSIKVLTVTLALVVSLLPVEIQDFEDVLLEGSVADRPLPVGVEHAINLAPSVAIRQSRLDVVELGRLS